MGARDAAPADAEQQEEESDTVADFAPESAASGAPEELPLTTGHSPEAELPREDYEQGLGQVQPSDEAVAEGADADVDVDVEPTAVQEEGAESEHPLAYHPISSVLARPTILMPAVTLPSLRIDRTGIWQAARGALPGVEAAASVEPLEPSTDADPFQLPQAAWVSPREWIRNAS